MIPLVTIAKLFEGPTCIRRLTALRHGDSGDGEL
jgi:hypothetical protein